MLGGQVTRRTDVGRTGDEEDRCWEEDGCWEDR